MCYRCERKYNNNIIINNNGGGVVDVDDDDDDDDDEDDDDDNDDNSTICSFSGRRTWLWKWLTPTSHARTARGSCSMPTTWYTPV